MRNWSMAHCLFIDMCGVLPGFCGYPHEENRQCCSKASQELQVNRVRLHGDDVCGYVSWHLLRM